MKLIQTMAFMLVISSFGQAQSIQLTSLMAAIQLAEQNSFQLKQLEAQTQFLKYDQRIASGALLPSLNSSASSDYNLELPVQLIPAEIFGGPAGSFQEVRFGQNYNSNLAFQFEAPIVHADKLAGRQMAVENRLAAESDEKTVRNNYLRNIAGLYLNILVIRQAIEVNTELDSTAYLLYNTTKQRFNEELNSVADLNRTENLMLSNYQQTRTLKASENIAINQLKMLLGLESENDLEIIDQLNNYIPDFSVVSGDPFNRNQVIAAEHQLNSAKWNYKKSQYAWLPKLSFNSRYTFANQTNQLLSGDGFSYQFGTVGLSATMPLFGGFVKYNQQKKAALNYRAAEFNLNQIKIEAATELSEWQIRLKEKSDAKILAERRAMLANQTLELSIMNYDEGFISLDQLFNVYGEYAQSKNNYLQILADAIKYETWLKLELN